jgi:hypothetical protein
MSDNRPPRYVEEDGRVIYRASGLGMCDKMFVALSMGYDPRAYPAWFQEVLDEGTENEAVIRGMWEAKESIVVTDIGYVTEMEVLDGIWIRGSIDGLYHAGQSDIRLQEYKKIRDSGWLRYQQTGVEFQANYPMQTAFYMHSLSEEFGSEVSMDFVGGHYVQDEKTEEWSITEVFDHRYLTPPVPLIGIKKRIAKLERLINETEAIGDIACNISMFPCPVYYLHDEDADEPPVRPGDDVLKPLLDEWQAAETDRLELAPKLKAIEAAQKRIKEGVMGWLQAAGQDSGDVCTTEIAGVEYGLKYLVSPRAGYEVKPTEQTRVTIKVTKKDGEKVANAPKKSSPRRKPAPAPSEAEGVSGTEEQAPAAAPVKKALAPRRGTK